MHSKIGFQMSWEPTDEQRAFREGLRAFLREHAPSAALRRAASSERGYDPALWQRLTRELALPGVAIAEVHGGQGFGPYEQALVQRELGYALAATPYFASAVLAAGALAEMPATRERDALLTALAAGETATLAWVEPGAGFGLDEVAMTVEGAGAELRLRGAKTVVVDGHSAEHLLVVARLPGTRAFEGLVLLRVAGDARGLARRRVESFDSTRALAWLDFDGVAATPIGVAGHDGEALARALTLATVALAQEMVGTMERVVEMAVGYAKERTQFGRAIGSFQAVKHKCADLWIALEAARAAADAASERAASDGADVAEAASLAKAWCSEACFRAAAENIQIHGGIGFTFEHDAHLFFRRAKSAEIFLGDAVWHRERLAAGIGLAREVA
jgi:alkylation response protein AidB-like acyl-CoA dehydrogenase